MVERSAPQTPEAEAALRQVEAEQRRRHRWDAMFCSMVVSVHTTLILHTRWDSWPLDARDLWTLALLVMNALGSLGLTAWNLRWLRTDEALERQRALDWVRWTAERHIGPWHRGAGRDPEEAAAIC
jgi:hypothetical protein